MRIGLDFPQRYYPRSFLSLLLLAFALVAVPLVVAFYNAAVYVEQLAGQSQTAVSQAAQASRGSRLLVEQTTALERVVRQYLILDDEELLKDYARLRELQGEHQRAFPAAARRAAAARAQQHHRQGAGALRTVARQAEDGGRQEGARGRLFSVVGAGARRAQYEQRLDRPRGGVHATHRRARAAHPLAAARGDDTARDTPCGRSHPPHRETDPSARPGDPAPRRGRVRRRYPGRRAGGSEIPGQPARLAASAADRTRTTETPVPAARLARAENATDGPSRRIGAAGRGDRRSALAGPARNRRNPPAKERAIAAADRRAVELPSCAGERGTPGGDGGAIRPGRGTGARRSPARGPGPRHPRRPAAGPDRASSRRGKITRRRDESGLQCDQILAGRGYDFPGAATRGG